MQPNNILLLNPPAPGLFIRDYYCSFESKANYYWPPQDLLVLSGLLIDFNVHVIDAVINRTRVKDIVDFILEQEIDTLIFSTGTATMKYDRETIDYIKKKTNVFIVASSGILKYQARQFFERIPLLDAALLDFTDPEIPGFIRDPQQKQWNTIWVKKGENVVEAKKVFSAEFAYPPPQHNLFPYKKYFIPIAKKHPFAEIITTMGCPYQCRFCTIPGYGTKYRNIENIMAEMREIYLQGFKELLFQDPTLTVNSKFLTQLLSRMIEEEFQFGFSCNSDINSMNEAKIALLKDAGCHTVNIGLESGDNDILKRYKKKLNTEKAREVVGLFKRYKIRTLGYFIIGLPGETEETIMTTIKMATSLKLDFASFAIATPDVGSDLRREAIEEGWIKEDVDFFDSTENPVLQVPGLSIEQIIRLRNLAERKFYLRPSYILGRLLKVKELRQTIRNGSVMLKRILFK